MQADRRKPRVILALLASAAFGGAAAGPQIDPSDLPKIFADACLDGAVRLTPEQASEIQIKDAPPSLVKRFGTPISGHIWRLNSGGSSFLYIFEYRPGKRTSPKACGLASSDITLESAMELLRRRLRGVIPSDFHRPATAIAMVNAQDGYSAAATRVDHFTVLEIKQLTPQQQRRMLRELHSTNSQVPKSPRSTTEQK